MVCLKAKSEILDWVMRTTMRKADFVDEDLNDMRTAVAVGPLDREEADEMFGDLSLA